LKETDQVFSCLHVENYLPAPVELTLIWEVEYEAYVSQQHPSWSDTVLVASWFYDTKTSKISQLLSSHFELVSYIEFMKDVRVLGVMIHSHPWLEKVQYKYRENDILLHNHEALDDEKIDLFTVPQFISAGDRLYFKLYGESEQPVENTQLAISAFVACDDGTSEVGQKSELYTMPCDGYFECIECAHTKKSIQCAPSVNGNNDPFGVYSSIKKLKWESTGALNLKT